MNYILSLLDPLSLPVSKLEEATYLCSEGTFELERPLIQQEKYNSKDEKEIADNIFLELYTSDDEQEVIEKISIEKDGNNTGSLYAEDDGNVLIFDESRTIEVPDESSMHGRPVYVEDSNLFILDEQRNIEIVKDDDSDEFKDVLLEDDGSGTTKYLFSEDKIDDGKEPSQLCAIDWFVVERKEEVLGRAPLLQEQYRMEGKKVLDNLLIELNIPNFPQYLYDETAAGIGQYLHTNFKIRYDILSARLLDDISASLGFKSMAYRDAWDYARINHTHPDDYNKLKCHPVYTSADVIQMGGERKSKITDMEEWLGTLVIYQQVGKQYLPISHDLFMPHFTFEDFPQPDIGEARFVGWKQFPTTSTSPYKSTTINGTEMIYDSENDGYWVYPRGQTITCKSTEFRDACKEFAGNANATSFQIKDLRSFIRLNPRTDFQNPCRWVQFQNGALPNHTHSVPSSPFGNQSFSGNVSIKMGKNGNPNGEYLHGAHGKTPKSYLNVSGSLRLSSILNGNAQDSSIAESATETKPYHSKIPLIVYIGRK